MREGLTTYKLTSSTLDLIKRIREVTGLPKSVIQKKALEYFMAGDQKIDSKLLISRTKDPDYVKRDAKDQIFLTEKIREELKKIAEKNVTNISTVIFQAVLNYSIVLAEELIPDELDIKK